MELVTDTLGITHVFGKTDADVMFGQGYAMARDRLFDMELNRRRALGTQAEVLGESALTADISSRTMNFAALAELDHALLKSEQPEDLALLDAWVSGVNQRIAEVARGEAFVPFGLRTTELGFVPEPWTVVHTLAIGKTLAFGLSSSLDYEILATAIRRIAPGAAEAVSLVQPAFDTAILDSEEALPPPPPNGPLGPSFGGLGAPKELAEPFYYRPIWEKLGSNNWAIDAAHSTNGRPLLAGDPHQPLTSPSRLWATHISSAEGGGSLDVIGFSFVGTPAVQLGHNAHIGWTATTNYADVMDIWDLGTTGIGTSVSLGGTEQEVVTRSEVIQVKGADAVTIDIRDVPGFGVILPDEVLPVPRAALADGAILFNWIGFGATHEASAYLALDRAKNIDEMEQAVDMIDVGAVNFVAADSKEIAYRAHTNVPDRGDPSARPMPWHIVSADDAGSFWTGKFLPADKLPKLRQPTSGFISSANNDPFGFTKDGSPENDPFYYGGVYAMGFRAFRIHELIREKLAIGKMDRSDLEEIQKDTRQPMVDTLVPRLMSALAKVGKDAAFAEFEGRADLVDLGERLASWDGFAQKESHEQVVFFALQWFAARRVFEDKFTSLLFYGIAEESSPYFIGQLRNVLEGRFAGSEVLLPDGAEILLLRALSDTSQWLTARFGSLAAPFVWSDIHAAELRSVYGDGLKVPLIAKAGAVDTINVSDCGFFSGSGEINEKMLTHDGSVYRMAIEFDESGRPRSTINFSNGVNGEPGNKHFSDQNERWAKEEYVPLPFAREEVLSAAESTVVLPGK